MNGKMFVRNGTTSVKCVIRDDFYFIFFTKFFLGYKVGWFLLGDFRPLCVSNRSMS